LRFSAGNSYPAQIQHQHKRKEDSNSFHIRSERPWNGTSKTGEAHARC
jgi:hypothetical protein